MHDDQTAQHAQGWIDENRPRAAHLGCAARRSQTPEEPRERGTSTPEASPADSLGIDAAAAEPAQAGFGASTPRNNRSPLQPTRRRRRERRPSSAVDRSNNGRASPPGEGSPRATRTRRCAGPGAREVIHDGRADLRLFVTFGEDAGDGRIPPAERTAELSSPRPEDRRDGSRPPIFTFPQNWQLLPQPAIARHRVAVLSNRKTPLVAGFPSAPVTR